MFVRTVWLTFFNTKEDILNKKMHEQHIKQGLGLPSFKKIYLFISIDTKYLCMLMFAVMHHTLMVNF